LAGLLSSIEQKIPFIKHYSRLVKKEVLGAELERLGQHLEAGHRPETGACGTRLMQVLATLTKLTWESEEKGEEEKNFEKIRFFSNFGLQQLVKV
jgi:hypothetical protein